MDEKDLKYFEAYLKRFGDNSSMIGSLVKIVLDQEKRIIALEKKYDV